jgi:uncharacterized membrane protein
VNAAAPANSSDALKLGAAALVALFALEIVWHAWLAPADGARFWPTLLLAVAPLLPGLWICFGNLRRGVLVGGIVGLFYFSHGVALLLDPAAPRVAAAIEVALTLLVIGASGWDARKYKRGKMPDASRPDASRPDESRRDSTGTEQS